MFRRWPMLWILVSTAILILTNIGCAQELNADAVSSGTPEADTEEVYTTGTPSVSVSVSPSFSIIPSTATAPSPSFSPESRRPRRSPRASRRPRRSQKSKTSQSPSPETRQSSKLNKSVSPSPRVLKSRKPEELQEAGLMPMVEGSPVPSKTPSVGLKEKTKNPENNTEDEDEGNENGKGSVRERLEQGPFPKPKRPEEKLNLIPEVAKSDVRKCERQAKRFEMKNGYFSIAQHACCLFGKGSGFCRRSQNKRKKVCNQKPLKFDKRGALIYKKNNRSEVTEAFPSGRCCIAEMEKKKGRYLMTCLEDQTTKRKVCNKDCAKLDDRCGRGNVECKCNFDNVWIYPARKKIISKYLSAGTTVFANKCYAEDKDSPTVLTQIFCCGMPVNDKTTCLFINPVCAY